MCYEMVISSYTTSGTSRVSITTSSDTEIVLNTGIHKMNTNNINKT
jgi:hypothetical protein